MGDKTLTGKHGRKRTDSERPQIQAGRWADAQATTVTTRGLFAAGAAAFHRWNTWKCWPVAWFGRDCLLGREEES